MHVESSEFICSAPPSFELYDTTSSAVQGLLVNVFPAFIFSAELMDYLIENGQQIDVLYWARVFNLVDKYPPVSLLKGYVEKAKQTAIEISQKNITRESLVCARNRLSGRIFF